MQRLDVAVLMRLPRLNLLHLQAVMIHQALITTRELSRVAQVVHRRAQSIGTMPARRAAQLPQSLLKPSAQTLKTLGMTYGNRFPIRISQHEVVRQMIE